MFQWQNPGTIVSLTFSGGGGGGGAADREDVSQAKTMILSAKTVALIQFQSSRTAVILPGVLAVVTLTRTNSFTTKFG